MYRHSNNTQLKEYYKRYCTILKKVINLANKLYYDEQIEFSSNRVKSIWKIIKDITGKTQSPVTNMKIKCDAGILTNINDIVKAINIYFANIAEDLNNNSSDVDKAWQSLKSSNPESSSEMKSIPVTETKVIDIIISLKHKNSSGYDGITNNIKKHCVNEISKQ